MSIQGPASFIPTTNAFLAHWGSADAALGAAGPLVLKTGKAVGDLLALRNTLQTQRAEVEQARNGREEARANLEASKGKLLGWLNKFNPKLEALTSDPKWLSMRPGAFQQGDGMAKVIRPLDDAADVWSRYEAESATTVTLLGGTVLGDFTAELALLKALYTDYAVQDNALSLARSERNATQELIRPILVGYRQKIPTEFAEGSAILETLPRYSPLPGHTPEPVNVSGIYNAGAGGAEISWSESTDATLVEYEVRGVAGPDYDADDESVIANISPNAPRTWSGNFGLGVPGAQAAFRVYVMTSTGNERASNTLLIERPLT